MWTLRERIFIRAQYHGEVCGEGSGGIGLVQQGEASVRVSQGCIGVHDTRLD